MWLTLHATSWVVTCANIACSEYIIGIVASLVHNLLHVRLLRVFAIHSIQNNTNITIARIEDILRAKPQDQSLPVNYARLRALNLLTSDLPHHIPYTMPQKHLDT